MRNRFTLLRYLNTEVLQAMCAITGILLLIFLSNQFVRLLGSAATGKFGGEMIARLIAIEIPNLLGVLLPLGLFLGILFVYGKLYSENEMTVLHACGFSRAKLNLFTLPITTLVIVITSVLALWITPQLNAYRDNLMAQAGTALELDTTLPGRFQSADDGRKVFYVENVTLDKKHMRNIFMAQLGKTVETPGIVPWIIFSAAGGYQTLNPKNGDHFFIATQGHRYQGTPGNKNFQLANFDQYGIRIESKAVDLDTTQDAMSTYTLLHTHKDKRDVASELQWRFSIPLSAFLLALLGVALSRVKPRQGKYAALLPAILIYIIYANLLLVGRSWIEQGTLPRHFGLWWIHISLFIVIGFIWLYQIGWKRIYGFWKKNT
jgi:lipopolysaccharide export system permease protein